MLNITARAEKLAETTNLSSYDALMQVLDSKAVTKPQTLAYAAERGITVDPGWTKKQAVEAIRQYVRETSDAEGREVLAAEAVQAAEERLKTPVNGLTVRPGKVWWKITDADGIQVAWLGTDRFSAGQVEKIVAGL